MPPRGRFGPAAAAFVFLPFLPLPACAQETSLGRTDFPNSGPPAAQAPFIEGVLLLHSFEYERAAASFRAAQRIAPDFALAYWGEALTHTHPIWFRQDRAAGLEILSRLGETPEARAARAPTERERTYLEAIEILYGPGPKARRDTLYARAMGQLRDRWPDDENAAAFYALALLGTSHGGRDIPTYMRAAAVAEEVYERNPDHPGALHYLIHAYDDPVHAPLGLRAARRYSVIAGDAPHAQHMTTHIFVAMGMWDDVVSQNEIASGPDPDAWLPGHYTWWLGYGYVQQGRHRDAAAHLDAMRRRTPPDAPAGRRAHLLRMRAEYVANTGRWADPYSDWTIERPRTPAGFGAALAAVDDYVRGRSALARGDLAGANAAANALAALNASATAAADPNDPTPGVARVMEIQLRGLLAREEGRAEEGLDRLRAALALEQSLPFEFGPPLVVIPSGELLGETLLEEGQAADAVAAFRATLQVAPGRATSLLGLARAAAAAGDTAMAAQAYAELLANWHRADPDLQALAEARHASR
jgi:tetratricopeptide (TPR) repeat protein